MFAKSFHKKTCLFSRNCFFFRSSKSSSKRCSSSTKTNMDVHNSLPSLSLSSTNNKNYLTMTGTIKRGKNLPEKSLDIQLSVTPDHLTKLEKRVHDKYHDRCFCGLRRGPHVFLVSLLSIPFMLIYRYFFFKKTMCIFWTPKKLYNWKIFVYFFPVHFKPFSWVPWLGLTFFSTTTKRGPAAINFCHLWSYYFIHFGLFQSPLV